MASLTRSDSISPFRAKLATKPSFVEPELRHAMPILRRDGVREEPRTERKDLVRNGNVRTVAMNAIRRSFERGVLNGVLVRLCWVIA